MLHKAAHAKVGITCSSSCTLVQPACVHPSPTARMRRSLLMSPFWLLCVYANPAPSHGVRSGGRTFVSPCPSFRPAAAVVSRALFIRAGAPSCRPALRSDPSLTSRLVCCSFERAGAPSCRPRPSFGLAVVRQSYVCAYPPCCPCVAFAPPVVFSVCPAGGRTFVQPSAHSDFARLHLVLHPSFMLPGEDLSAPRVGRPPVVRSAQFPRA